MIAKRAEGVGARTAVVLMPARFQTDDPDFGRLAQAVARRRRRTRAARGDGPLSRRRWRRSDCRCSTCCRSSAPQPDRGALFFQRNVHFTPRGHVVASRAPSSTFLDVERSGRRRGALVAVR